MQRFFVEPHQIDGERHEIHITGSDVNHIVNVLRMKKGEELWISDKDKTAGHCALSMEIKNGYKRNSAAPVCGDGEDQKLRQQPDPGYLK